MRCAAIDIGSNTTRILVAEPQEGQLKKVMEQRAYTRIGKAKDSKDRISKEKIDEVAEVVETQVKLAREVGAEAFRAVATAAIRDARNGERAVKEIGARAGIPIEIVSEREEGRLAFLGATKALGHPMEGTVAVVDVGGGSTEITTGSVSSGIDEVRSWPIGSGMLAEELISGDPPSASEIRRTRDRVDDAFEGVEIEQPDQVVAVGGSATSLRRLVGVVLEYETLERGIRVLCSRAEHRRRPPVRTGPGPGPDVADRGTDPGEALGDPRPPASDRQRRHPRRHSSRSAQRQRRSDDCRRRRMTPPLRDELGCG